MKRSKWRIGTKEVNERDRAGDHFVYTRKARPGRTKEAVIKPDSSYIISQTSKQASWSQLEARMSRYFRAPREESQDSLKTEGHFRREEDGDRARLAASENGGGLTTDTKDASVNISLSSSPHVSDHWPVAGGGDLTQAWKTIASPPT